MLNDKVCLVTGCGRGIGRAIAEVFAEHGAVVYANDRLEGTMDSWAETLNERSKGEVRPVYFDVTDESAVKACVMQIKKEAGRLDVLVNNAGIMQDAPIGMITAAMIDRTLSVNVVGPMQLIQYASKLMKRQKSGSIINMASIMGQNGNKNQMLYSASKGAVIAMTKAAAKELAPLGIRVNAVAPGVVDTELFRQVGDKAQEFVDMIGIGRAAAPEDVANVCLFLASDLSGYVTGEVVGVNGAMVV